MKESRPDIPAHIKREVRRQCGFGCAICGMPFFEYDHIEEYAGIKEHTADNLILLCPNHHSSKTTKKLSKERIREAKSHPFNKGKARTTVYKIEPAKQLTILLGSNLLSGWSPDINDDYDLIWINGKSFFTIHSENGWLSVSLEITDDEGNTLLYVERGELIVYTAAWDYVYEGNNIKIRTSLRKIILDFNLSDRKVEVLKGMFLDKNLDGLVVESERMFNIIDGNRVGVNARNESYGMSGWGLLNSRKHPLLQPPKSFAYFYVY